MSEPVLKSYEEVIATLPEKQEVWVLSHSEIEQAERESFNQAIDQMKAAIDELYGIKS